MARQYRETALDELGSRNLPSEKVIEQRFQAAFQHIRLPFAELRYGTTRTEGLWFWKRVAASVFPQLNDKDLTRLTRSLFQRFERASAWSVFSGARRVLRNLKNRDVTLALLSNWDARGPDLLRNLQLSSFFTTCVFSSGVGYEKPDRRIFDEVLNRLDQDFRRIVMIGNHVEIDLREPARRDWDALLFCPGSDDEWPREVSEWDEIPNQIFNSY